MTDLTNIIRSRHIRMMGHTLQILQHIFRDVTQEEATTLRDGPDGWSLLEILCHLRDFDVIFYTRAAMMAEQDNPHLPGYDHLALVEERRYNEQNLHEVLEALAASRARFISFFEGLTPEQWERGGLHAERGFINLTDAVVQVGTHEVDHIEQITRVLKQRA